MCLGTFLTIWGHHTLPFAYQWIAINFSCFIYVILKLAISLKAFIANLIQTEMKNLILFKYKEIIYHMIALLLYVLNMQENSRFSLRGMLQQKNNSPTSLHWPCMYMPLSSNIHPVILNITER